MNAGALGSCGPGLLELDRVRRLPIVVEYVTMFTAMNTAEGREVAFDVPDPENFLPPIGGRAAVRTAKWTAHVKRAEVAAGEAVDGIEIRLEERGGGKESRSRWASYH